MPTAISPELAAATDTLLACAMDAVESAGADLGGQAISRHALVMPGEKLREVQQALSNWNLVSCAQGSCESWTHPMAQAAQQVFQAVDHLFEQSSLATASDASDEARIPFLVSEHQMSVLMDSSHQWSQATRLRARRILR